MQTSKRKERQQVTGAGLMGLDWWGHAVPGGQVPLQSSQEAKLFLPPRTVTIKPDLLTGKHSFLYRGSWSWPTVQARSGMRCGQRPPLSPPIHTIYTGTVTMDLCYPGESVTRDNFYLTFPRATLKQNAALSLPLLRCLIWQLLSSFMWKPSVCFSDLLVWSEWVSKWCTSCKAPNSQPVTAFQTLQVHHESMSRESICFREIKCQAEAAYAVCEGRSRRSRGCTY